MCGILYVSDQEMECARPGCKAAGSKKCGNCKAVGYCKVACQRDHWPEHKAVCSKLLDHRVAGAPDNEFASFQERMRQRQHAHAAAKEQVTELLATLIGTPNSPVTHANLAFAYRELMRPADAIESLSKALMLLLTSHPDADTEVEILSRAPVLVESALVGRSKADDDWYAEVAVAAQLVQLAERLGPSGCPPNALSNARRTLAHTHKRRGCHAEAVAMFHSADAAAAPLRDLKALQEIPDVEMSLAHTEQEPKREVHTAAAVAAARAALEAAPRGDSAHMEAEMLLARIIYASLCLANAPRSPIIRRQTIPGMLPSDSWADTLRLAPNEPLALEAQRLAQSVRAEATRRGTHRVWNDLAALLCEKLERAGLPPAA